MDEFWLKLDKDTLVSSIVSQMKKCSLKKNDINLLFCYIKHLTESEHLIAKEIEWLKQFTLDLNFEVRPLVASIEDQKDKNEINKILIEIVKITCRLNGIAEHLLKKCFEKLEFTLTQLDDSSYEKSHEEKLSLCVNDTLHLLQFICDSQKSSCSTEFCFDLLTMCNRILTTEWVLEKQFVNANHIISYLLDGSKEEHIKVLKSSLHILQERKDYTKLFLLLAIQLDKLLHSTLVQEDFFWILLQDGLVCSDSLTRKRSLYIIKCILDVISKKDTFITHHETGESAIVCWQKENSGTLWKVWKAFVLVSETLEEKQVHVINPVLPSVKDILEISNEQKFHYSWLLIILQRAMEHESKIIQTWAVKFTLSLDLSKYPLLSQPDHGFVFNVLFESLKNIFLYHNEDDVDPGSSPKLLPLLKGFFKNCFEVLKGQQQLQFCLKVMETISDSTFNQIALVYITMALSCQKLHTELDEANVSVFRSFLVNKLPVYSKEFQTIIFHNLSRYVCSNTVSSLPNMEKLLSVLSTAFAYEILTFNTRCWSVWKEFYGSSKITDLNEFLQSKVSTYISDTTNIHEVIMRSTEVVVLTQLSNDNNLSVDKALSLLLDILPKLATNPYLSNEKILKCLQFVDLQVNKDVSDNVQNIVLECLGSLLDYMKLKLFSANEKNEVDLDILTCCLNIVAGLVTDAHSKSHASLARFFNNIVDTLLIKSVRGVDGLDGNHRMLSLAQYKMLAIGIDFVKNSERFGAGGHDLLLTHVIYFTRKDLAKLKSRFNCDSFISSSWTIVKSILDGPFDEQEGLLITFLSDVTMASNDTIIILTDFAKYFVDIFDGWSNDVRLLCEVIDCMWRIINNHIRDGQDLWAIYTNCIQTIFHEKIVCHASEVIVNKVRESWDQIFELGQRKMAVTSIAVEQFLKVWPPSKAVGTVSHLGNYIDILVKIATFGPLRQKKERPFHYLFTYMDTLSEYDGIDTLKSFQHHDQQVRTIFTSFMLNLPITKDSSNLVVQFVQSLMEFDQNITTKCYFINSLIHRQKLRCWQLVLVLLPKLPKDFDFGELLVQLLTCCKSDNQLSVRYFIEWAIVLVLRIDGTLIGKLLERFDVASEKRIFSVTFILSTIYQLVKSVNGDQFKYLANACVQSILPWSHAQHRTSRIHSQITLELIWQRIQRNTDSEELKEKFYYLEYFFALTETNSSSVKHRKDLAETFYYQHFHAVKDYNLESIFYTFLKENGVIADEWVAFDKFQLAENVHTNFKMLNVKLRSEDARAEVTISPKAEVQKSDVVEDTVYVDTQKKIMPWNLVPSDDLILQSELSRKKDHGTSDLILCAVLVDKIPNLGGLSRTAEIFGVKRLLIGSSRYLADPSFKSLSVTSEKWLDIEQVIPVKLASYLQEMREEGYTIVGVEQTANSSMIGEFKFPKKSILVLGNEKTGIPVDLIQMLDECVEIPQLGIIRSLNVHISGAIMVWEYCKQHQLNSI